MFTFSGTQEHRTLNPKPTFVGLQVAFRVVTEAEHNLIRSPCDRVDAQRHFGGAGGEGTPHGNGNTRAAGAAKHNNVGAGGVIVDKALDAQINVDACMQCGGAEAVSGGVLGHESDACQHVCGFQHTP